MFRSIFVVFRGSYWLVESIRYGIFVVFNNYILKFTLVVGYFFESSIVKKLGIGFFD